MAVSRHSFADAQEFTAWTAANLVPSYFGAVDFDDNWWYGYEDAEKTKPIIAYEFGWSPRFRVYKSPAVYNDITGVGGYSALVPNIYTCGGGVLFDAIARNLCAIIAKTNNDVTASIIGGSDNGDRGYFAKVYAYALGDDTTITTQREFNTRASAQTCLVPFCTDATFGNSSYTPKAFYMPEAQYYSSGMGTFTAGGKTYLTNGYWAILDDSD